MVIKYHLNHSRVTKTSLNSIVLNSTVCLRHHTDTLINIFHDMKLTQIRSDVEYLVSSRLLAYYRENILTSPQGVLSSPTNLMLIRSGPQVEPSQKLESDTGFVIDDSDSPSSPTQFGAQDSSHCSTSAYSCSVCSEY